MIIAIRICLRRFYFHRRGVLVHCQLDIHRNIFRRDIPQPAFPHSNRMNLLCPCSLYRLLRTSFPIERHSCILALRLYFYLRSLRNDKYFLRIAFFRIFTQNRHRAIFLIQQNNFIRIPLQWVLSCLFCFVFPECHLD